MPDAFLHRLRTMDLDDLGQPVRYVTAQGGEPCRDALRRAAPVEPLLLASFSPFALASPYRENGPVFVRAEGEATAASENLFTDEPDAYFGARLVLRAYAPDESILDAALVEREEAVSAATAFLARPGVAFVHARFPTYGCFALRLEAGA